MKNEDTDIKGEPDEAEQKEESGEDSDDAELMRQILEKDDPEEGQKEEEEKKVREDSEGTDEKKEASEESSGSESSGSEVADDDTLLKKIIAGDKSGKAEEKQVEMTSDSDFASFPMPQPIDKKQEEQKVVLTTVTKPGSVTAPKEEQKQPLINIDKESDDDKPTADPIKIFGKYAAQSRLKFQSEPIHDFTDDLSYSQLQVSRMTYVPYKKIISQFKSGDNEKLLANPSCMVVWDHDQ